MEWKAPKINFYALVAAIFNPELSSNQALSMMGITVEDYKEKRTERTPGAGRQKKLFAPPKEELEALYQTKTQYEIAKHYKTSQCSVSKWLRQYGIEKPNPYCIPKEKLIELYVNQGKTIHQVATACRVSITKVYTSMELYGIPSRRKQQCGNH